MYFCWQPQHPVVTSRAITANCIFELLHEIGLLHAVEVTQYIATLDRMTHIVCYNFHIIFE